MRPVFLSHELEELTPIEMRLDRNADVCVIIPTCKSADVTAHTIIELYKLHQERMFDVLLIDNGGCDYPAIAASVRRETGEDINYILLDVNAGSAGSHYLGIRHALRVGYVVLVLSDNDATMLTENGVTKLVAALAEADFVYPANIAMCGRSRKLPFELHFHYVTFNARLIDKIGLPDPFLFLYGDDMNFAARVLAQGLKIVEVHEVLIEHLLFKPGIMLNDTAYFTVRNHLHTLLRHSMRWRDRMQSLAYVLLFSAVKMLHAAQLRDSTIVRTILRAVRDALFKRLSLPVSRNSFRYEWMRSPGNDQKALARWWAPLKNRVLLREFYSVVDLQGHPAYIKRVLSPE